MKINNRQQTALTMYALFCVLVADLVFFIAGKYFLAVPSEILYPVTIAVLIFTLWRIIRLKRFSLEVSEHIVSVKYRHPLIKNNHPILEVPLQKIISFQLEKAVINNILVIGVNTKRGIRTFYFNVGPINGHQKVMLQKMSEFVKAACLN